MDTLTDRKRNEGRKQVDSKRLLGLARYLLPVVVVGVCVGAWYSDVIADLFAHRTRAADVTGDWVLDDEGLARVAAGAASIAPAGPQRDALTASLLTKAEPYRGVTLSFAPGQLTIRGPSGTRELPGVFEGFSESALAFRPQGERSISIIVDEPGKRIRLAQPLMSIPLKRAE